MRFTGVAVISVASVSLGLICCVQENNAATFGKIPVWGRPSGGLLATTQSSKMVLTQVPRGGGAPGEAATEKQTEITETVDAEDLYLPGLLQTTIFRSNRVCFLEGSLNIASFSHTRSS